MEQTNADLYAALHRAQQQAECAAKDGKHEYYNYATAEEIIRVAKQAMRDTGLAVACVGNEIIGGPDDLMLRSTFVVTHASGQSLTATADTPIIPGKGRPADKAAFGSKTEALAYFLRDLLQIPRNGDAGDVSGRVDSDCNAAPRQYDRAPQRQQQAPTQQGGDDAPTVRQLLTRCQELYPAREQMYECAERAAMAATNGRCKRFAELTPEERIAAMGEIQ